MNIYWFDLAVLHSVHMLCTVRCCKVDIQSSQRDALYGRVHFRAAHTRGTLAAHSRHIHGTFAAHSQHTVAAYTRFSIVHHCHRDYWY